MLAKNKMRSFRLETTPAERNTMLAAMIAAVYGAPSVAQTPGCFAPGGGRFDPAQKESLLSSSNCNLPVMTAHGVAPVRSVQVEVDRDGIPADGVSPARVTVRLFDRERKPIKDAVIVTIEASGGRVVALGQTDDADPRTPGTQLKVENGLAEFLLLAPHAPQDVTLRVLAGRAEATGTISFVPEQRDLLAIGVVEGILSLKKLGESAVQPSRSDDGFERELRHISRESADGRRQAGLSTNFYLKGTVLGSVLLTAAYDSDKATRSRLFRDIRPEEFYPIYGDSALKGFDAQSTQKLYVRIDKDKSYLLYGDYTTHRPGEAISLSQYNRSLTGGKGHFETKSIKFTGFAAHDTTRQVIDEQPARGVSGPYTVSNMNGIRNSERVEIITRDRNQTSVILALQPMQRFADYTFEPFSGQVVFKQPIPTVDANFNPLTIRITYEVEDGGERYWIGGAAGQVKITDNIEVGASTVDDRNPNDPYKLHGANATLRLGERTIAFAEGARSERNESLKGNAARAEIRHDGERFKARAHGGQTDVDFHNPAATLNGGRREAGGKASYALTPGTKLYGEALATEQRSTHGKRQAAEAGVEQAITDSIRFDVAVRHAESSGGAASAGQAGLPNIPIGQSYQQYQVNAPSATPAATLTDTTSARARVLARVGERGSVFVEGEQDIHESDRHRAGLGGDYRIAEWTRLYGRYDWANSNTGGYGFQDNAKSSHLVFGADTRYMKDGQLFNEYRMRDSVNGRDAQTAAGLRNTWVLYEGVRALTGVERVQSLAGTDVTATAVSGGLEFSYNPLWKASLRGEFRRDPQFDSMLSTVAYLRKLSRDWSFIGRNYLNRVEGRTAGSGNRLQDRVQLGLAYRDTDTNRWNWLGRYEFKTERDSTAASSGLASRRVHVVSNHADYHPSRPWAFSGRLAAKWLEERITGADSNYDAYLAGVRAIYDITERIDVGLAASMLYSPKGSSKQYAAGGEIGYLVAQNLWFSVGYNWTGFKDRDLTGSDYTNRGVFVRLRFKFDEDLFAFSDRSRNRTISE